MLQRIRNHFNSLPEGKKYLELITALLSIPVLLTVVYTNYLNLQERDKQAEAAPQEKIVVVTGNQTESKEEPTPTNETCKKEIGPISISYPGDGETITNNPVNIIITYDKEKYCSVVWSYRINGGVWSPYSSNSISLYNMENGEKRLELRVQSTVSDDQEMLTREFTYEDATPSAEPTSSN